MNAFSPIHARIHRLLKVNTVMTIEQLSEELNHRARSSLFRDLQKLATISSYTHAGKYHALQSTSKFNSDGLWFYQGIGFSKYKTLKATIIHLIEASPIGHTHTELQDLLKIKTHNTLKDLVENKHISHSKMPNNRYVYLHFDGEKSKQQYSLRISMNVNSYSKVLPPPHSITIEILAEVIRSYNFEVQELLILKNMKKRNIEVDLETVNFVFNYYQIKKKPI